MKKTRKKATGPMDKILRTAGYATLSQKLGLAISTPWHWASNGLPASTHMGENDYAKVIAWLVRKEGYKCTIQQVLDASIKVRAGK